MLPAYYPHVSPTTSKSASSVSRLEIPKGTIKVFISFYIHRICIIHIRQLAEMYKKGKGKKISDTCNSEKGNSSGEK